MRVGEKKFFPRLVIFPDSTASAFLPSLLSLAWNIDSAAQNFGAHCAAGTVLADALVAVSATTTNKTPITVEARRIA